MVLCTKDSKAPRKSLECVNVEARMDVLWKPEGSTSHWLHWICILTENVKLYITYFDNNLDTSHILQIHLRAICSSVLLETLIFVPIWSKCIPFYLSFMSRICPVTDFNLHIFLTLTSILLHLPYFSNKF